MCSLDESVVIASLHVDLDTKAESIQVCVSRMSKIDGRMNFGLLRDVFLVCSRRGELESTEKTCYTPYQLAGTTDAQRILDAQE